MKKIRLVVFYILASTLPSLALPAEGADADTIKLSVSYAVKFYQYEGQQQPKNDEMVLELGNKYVHFYSLYSVKREHIKDSVLAAGGTAQDVQAAQEKSIFPRAQQHYQIWKNYPEPGKLTFADNVLKTFKYTESLSRPVWKLESNDSTIAGYACQKAVTHYMGRTWKVWYTPDIPVAEGPWKLNGLPGLILQAEDSDRLFSFSCIAIKPNPEKAMEFPKKKCVDCSKEEYYQLKKLMWLDPNGFTQKILGFKSEGFDAQGRKLVYPKRIALFLENNQ
jgi:GLPGLI family protein